MIKRGSPRLKVLSLCDGIASGLQAFKKLGITPEYHAVEIERYKRNIANANHKNIVRPCNDVVKFAKRKMIAYDFILCGFTCTSLTSQGSRLGWLGASKIFFDCAKIVNKVRAINPEVCILFENVFSMSNSCKDTISKILGVPAFKGEAGLVSAQDRNRWYWFNWEKPKIKDRKIDPVTVLDNDGLLLFSVSKSNRNRGNKASVEGRFKANGKAGTLVTGKGCRGQSTATFVVTKSLNVRQLTSNECATLQGLPKYKWPCTEAQKFKSIGDGWQIAMIKAILNKNEQVRKRLKFSRALKKFKRENLADC